MVVNRYKMLVDAIGDAATLELTAEECMELGHSLLKYARLKRGENPTNTPEDICQRQIVEELADLTICVDMIQRMDWFTDDEYNNYRTTERQKLKRFQHRLIEVGKLKGVLKNGRVEADPKAKVDHSCG